MPNRLATESSPYLLQHRDNPVDWFPWGDEAFAKAREQNRPVFLSVGYSSCHWCHVMAHESFESEAIAAILNESFVSVKVDREERPDVDEAYMSFVQMLNGHGGWPMSVFLTPDKLPFFGGTYWPKEDRGRIRGFGSICHAVAEAWRDDRASLERAAAEYTQQLRSQMGASGVRGDKLSRESLDREVEAISEGFDPIHGGFGRSPKFPPHSALEFLLAYASDPAADSELAARARQMALFTLEVMSLGGIHDHVGGGFHRYSTDERWLLPHFEKMLYDNALLLKSFAAANLTGVAERIVRWMERDMRSPDGLFYAALDADSEGKEGKYYVWSAAEILDPAFAAAFNVRVEGNFRDEASGRYTGENVLHLTSPASTDWQPELDRLLALRSRRVGPGLDSKLLVAWNGLAIEGLVAAGRRDLAEQAAKAVLDAVGEGDRLPRQIFDGEAKGVGFLEDYAHFAAGLVALSGEWLVPAKRFVAAMVERFYDDEAGGFFSTAEAHEHLFGRTKPVLDQPIPSANSAAVRLLIRFGDLERAEQSLAALSPWMRAAPHGTEGLYTALMEYAQVTDGMQSIGN